MDGYLMAHCVNLNVLCPVSKYRAKKLKACENAFAVVFSFNSTNQPFKSVKEPCTD